MTTHTDKIDAYLANADTTGKTVGDLAEDALFETGAHEIVDAAEYQDVAEHALRVAQETI